MEQDNQTGPYGIRIGPHLTETGRFRSDKYPWCPEGFFAVKVLDVYGRSDPLGRAVALIYAHLKDLQPTGDKELVADLKEAVRVADRSADAGTNIQDICDALEGRGLLGGYDKLGSRSKLR